MNQLKFCDIFRQQIIKNNLFSLGGRTAVSIVLAVCLVGCNGSNGGPQPTPAPTTGTGETIITSPATITLNNPTGNTPNQSQQFTINFTAFNSSGNQLMPSNSNPIHVDVYGAPNGVITPLKHDHQQWLGYIYL